MEIQRHTQRRTPGRDSHASYNVAKKVVEFEYKEVIPRSRLQAAYGDGFKGAPLRCHSLSEGAFSRDAGMCNGEAIPSPQTCSTSWQIVPIVGGSRHV